MSKLIQQTSQTMQALAQGKMQKTKDSEGGRKINIFMKRLIQKTKQYVQAWTKRMIQTTNY